MTVAALGLEGSIQQKNLPLFLTVFLALFVTTGLENGSTFRMILACLATTWWCYVRSSFLVKRLPNLSTARA